MRTPESVGAIHLVAVDLFPEHQRSAVLCVIEELKKDGEEPAAFFARIEDYSTSYLSRLPDPGPRKADVITRIRRLVRRLAPKRRTAEDNELRPEPADDDRAPPDYVFHLWHESAFQTIPGHVVLGNPGGRCLDFFVDVAANKVTKKLCWQ